MAENQDKLVVVWTSADKDVAVNMVFMYAHNSKLQNRWGDVILIIWGPSAKLLTEDTELQDYLRKMKESGVHVMACRKCAQNYGVPTKLEQLGIEVIYIGDRFTQFLKENYKVITF